MTTKNFAPKTPLLTVDCVAFDRQGGVLLIRRANPPFEGCYALPGGFVDIGESVEDACRRELLEETGMKAGKLNLIGVYSDPSRDPRGHTATVAYLTEIDGKPKASSDAKTAAFVRNWRDLELAFDHALILKAAQARLDRRRKRRVMT